MMKPEIRTESDVTIVTLGPEFERIDHETIAHCTEILDWVKSAEPLHMVLDLSHTESVNSEFLGLLFALCRVISRYGGQFATTGASDHCRQMFAVTKLDTLFEQFETSEDAVAAFSHPLELACAGST